MGRKRSWRGRERSLGEVGSAGREEGWGGGRQNKSASSMGRGGTDCGEPNYGTHERSAYPKRMISYGTKSAP